MAGGSLFLTSKNLVETEFKENLFHYKSSSIRPHIPPHIKSYFRRSNSEKSKIPWICLTSANVSKAAWGQLQKSATQLLIHHFEIGVLFINEDKQFTIAETPAIGDDFVQFPLPYDFLNPPKYNLTDAQNPPWVSDAPHMKPDKYGICLSNQNVL